MRRLMGGWGEEEEEEAEEEEAEEEGMMGKMRMRRMKRNDDDEDEDDDEEKDKEESAVPNLLRPMRLKLARKAVAASTPVAEDDVLTVVAAVSVFASAANGLWSY